MTREGFVHDLQQMQDAILELGSMVDKALHQAVDALKRRDHFLAQYVIKNDKNINEKRYNIEEQVQMVLATQQPVAHDLRLILTMLFIATELERMGDHAKGIARISELIGEQPLTKPLIDIPKMSEKCSKMLHAALDAFLKEDVAAARTVACLDDEVDLLYDQIYRDLLQMMLQDQQYVNSATYLIWAGHNLERFADRVVNICERIVFTATGEIQEIKGCIPEENGPQPISALMELEA